MQAIKQAKAEAEQRKVEKQVQAEAAVQIQKLFRGQQGRSQYMDQLMTNGLPGEDEDVSAGKKVCR